MCWDKRAENNAQLIPHLIVNHEENINHQISSGNKQSHAQQTAIYVENLLKVRSKNHGTNRSTPSQTSTIIKWVQGVFSRASRGLHQQQHTNQLQLVSTATTKLQVVSTATTSKTEKSQILSPSVISSYLTNYSSNVHEFW